MNKLIKKLKDGFKYPFHKIRNGIRYLRVLYEIKRLVRQIREKHPHSLLLLQSYNLGEVYVSCAYLQSIGKESVFLNSEDQKYTTQLINLFPCVSKVYFISCRTNNYLKEHPHLAKQLGIQSLCIYEHNFNDERPRNMVEAYKVLLGLNKNSLILHKTTLCKEQDTNKVHDIFAKEELKLEKTIIIIPEARSFQCSLLTNKFWIQLADSMAEKGYQVVFNSKDIYGEYSSVFLSIAETIVLANLCGYVIGVRSGLLDILAGETNAFIQAIYPSNNELTQNDCKHLTQFGLPPHSTPAEKFLCFFSLANIRNDGKITEIVLQSQNKEMLIEELLHNWNH